MFHCISMNNNKQKLNTENNCNEETINVQGHSQRVSSKSLRVRHYIR